MRAWPSSAALTVAVAGAIVVEVGWRNAPQNQLSNEPALTLAVIACAVAVGALLIGAVASFRTLRWLGLTVLLSVMTLVASGALLIWIAYQPLRRLKSRRTDDRYRCTLALPPWTQHQARAGRGVGFGRESDHRIAPATYGRSRASLR